MLVLLSPNMDGLPACGVHVQLLFLVLWRQSTRRAGPALVNLFLPSNLLLRRNNLPGANKTVLTKLHGNKSEIEQHKTAGYPGHVVCLLLYLCIAYRAKLSCFSAFTTPATIHRVVRWQEDPNSVLARVASRNVRPEASTQIRIGPDIRHDTTLTV